jgi:hypothetical protein
MCNLLILAHFILNCPLDFHCGQFFWFKWGNIYDNSP